jgi:NAD(P)-dependent dehydrogenase (short-subunit alcohol dehydrogenase family)
MVLNKRSAIVGFTRSYSALLAHELITINAVCPNIVRTNISTTEFYDIVTRKELFTPMESMVQVFDSLLGSDPRNGCIFECGPRGVMLRDPPYCMDEATKEACDLIRDRSVAMHRNSLYIDNE